MRDFGVELDAVDDVAAIARQRRRRPASRCRTSAAWRTGRRCGRPSPPAARRRRSAPPPSAGRRGRSRGCCRRRARRSSRRSRRPAEGKRHRQRRRKLLLQLARLACKNQRRKGGELGFRVLQRGKVRIGRNLLDRLCSPRIRRPFRHRCTQRSFQRAPSPAIPPPYGVAAPYTKPISYSRPELAAWRMVAGGYAAFIASRASCVMTTAAPCRRFSASASRG